MKIAIALLIASLFILPTMAVAPVQASTPTPLPTEHMYSASELLDRLGAKPYDEHIVAEVPDVHPQVIPLFGEGGSWFLTFIKLFSENSVMRLIMLLIGIFLMIKLTAYVLRRVTGGKTAAEVAPQIKMELQRKQKYLR